MMNIYQEAINLANKVEAELKQLGRWTQGELPEELFENMGAFGSNTMSFEQWLQFVLLPRIHEIVNAQGEFPNQSNLATYAVRYFDGDYAADTLREILYDIDQLINQSHNQTPTQTEIVREPDPPKVTVGDTVIPDVLYSLAEVLPQYELIHLESQLQTFDTFLSFLSPTVRPAISALLMKAAIRTTIPECRQRIEKAAQDILEGKRAAEPYNHKEFMKKYEEEHKKNFPPPKS